MLRQDGAKACTNCGQMRLLEEYNKKAEAKDGLRARCRPCQQNDSKSYAAVNKEKISAKGRAYHKANPDKVKAWYLARLADPLAKKARAEYAAAYYRKNKDRCNQMIRDWQLTNPHKRIGYQRKYALDPKAKMSSAIRACIRSEIVKGSKGGRVTFQLLGYSPEQLMTHLEKQFRDGMSWENYGRGGWHVDHIRPLASYNYRTPDDPEFKDAWGLANLQPLWQFENLSKGKRTDWELECLATAP